MRPVVLFTGGGGAGSEALYRLLEERYEVHFADADHAAIPRSIPEGRRHVIPFAGSSWVDGVHALCKKLSAAVLVPGVDEELPLVSTLAGRLPQLVCVCPSNAFIALMKDKLRSMNELARMGLSSPRTATIDEVNTFDFPCLVKPRDGRGSRGVQVLRSAEEVAAYRLMARRPDDQLVVQELLAGKEWTVYVSASRLGTLCSVIPVRVDVKRGITVRAETAYNPAIIEYCVQFHRQFPTPGPYNIQLMEGEDGSVSTFEVNPRISTTLCLAIAAGADPIADMMAGRPMDGLKPFEAGLYLQRYWSNHIGKV